MINLDALNREQRLAAETLDGPVLILAGAGSGKTRALTYRIANLIEHGVPGYRILALTFTNKAAREMRERAARLCGEVAEEAWISTFHSSCARILRRDGEKIGYTRAFSILDEDDRQKVIKEACAALSIGDELKPRDISQAIGDMKNKLLNADEWFRQSERTRRFQQLHDVICAYERRLKGMDAMDFDDLLVNTLTLLVEHPPVMDYYRDRFRYVLVDEYQDTNLAQYELVRALTQQSRNLCVVGDDDQCIYGWRGAEIKNILDFEKDYPEARVIKLERNYRSTANILTAANQIIAHNVGRKEKALWTEEKDGDKIGLYVARDERDEAIFIAGRMRDMVMNGMRYGDLCVLYRTHAQSRVIEDTLVSDGIPYRVFGGQRFYDRREVRDAVAYLRVLANPRDDLSLRRVINEPKRSIGETTIKALEKYAAEMEMPLLSALLAPPDTLAARALKAVSAFGETMGGLLADKDALPVTELLSAVYERCGLMAQFTAEENDENRERADNLRELQGAAADFEKRGGDVSLDAFLEQVALVTDMDMSEDSARTVTLMTLHSAKGLEFPCVFLVGMEEGLFPGLRAMTDDARMEEERRLCYVGVTRAMRCLFITRARTRMLYNQFMSNSPSRFIAEIPPRLMEDLSNVREAPAWSRPSASAQPPVGGGWGRAPRAPAKPDYQEKAAALPGKPPAPAFPGGLNIPGVSRGMPEPPAYVETYSPGDRVMHTKFGRGTVRAVNGTGASAHVLVAFDAEPNTVRPLGAGRSPMIKIKE